MSSIDQLFQEVRPSLRGVSPSAFRRALQGLENYLDVGPRRRTQLTVRRLRFEGEKNGDFRFYPGVNVLRAGNDKGKSSILKLIHFCLSGKNELKKDVDGWISRVELELELDGVPHTIQVDKGRRPRGRILRGSTGDRQRPATPLVEFTSGKEMQRKLEAFFNETFGLRPLLGTQKDSRKGSDALLDTPTSYRAYLRGMYINQDLGYTDLVTDGVPYGNLFMKVVGMLLGIRGIDAVFATEAKLAHLESQLAREDRYHRRLERAMEGRDLASLDEEIKNLETYIDERKTERTRLLVRATGNDLDLRLKELTDQIVRLDDTRQETAGLLRRAELELQTSEGEASALRETIAAHLVFSPIQPDHCPACTTPIASRPQPPRPGHCALCDEEVPAEREGGHRELAEERLRGAEAAIASLRKAVESHRVELQEIEVRRDRRSHQKRHLQSQLRSVHQGTEELEREIELETRYLGRLEAQRESASQGVSGEGGTSVRKLMQRKEILAAVLRHLRTRDAAINEGIKGDFARRVQQYCTTIGFPGLEEITFDAHLRPRIRQNGEVYGFDGLSPGEKVRFVLAFHLALAIVTGEDLEYGAHPGLLLIDSPGKEEMVHGDFEAVVRLLGLVEERHAATIQVIVATTMPAIREATRPEKQAFVKKDNTPLFQ